MLYFFDRKLKKKQKNKVYLDFVVQLKPMLLFEDFGNYDSTIYMKMYVVFLAG